MSKKEQILSKQQEELVNKVVYEKKNIFFTGCAGTGKSFILKYIVEQLREIYRSSEAVAITASTGKAAFNISGCTLHSFAGIGLGQGSKEDLANRAFFNPNAKDRWTTVKTLIIDEVSMIDGELFDKLEFIARFVNKSKQKFGGIQLVLVGDLLQLPPVSTSTIEKKKIFQAEKWKECIDEYILLTKVFRQEDFEFVKFLTCIRLGCIDEDVIKFMKKLEEKKDFNSESGPVELFATKNKTNQFNLNKLNQINSETVTYIATDKYINKNSIGILESCPVQKEIQLKVGAQVMLVKNLNTKLVNGTVGIITKFIKRNTENDDSQFSFIKEPIPIVRFTLADNRVFTKPIKRETWESVLPNGSLVASRYQMPLILSWAMTIHKSQGQTIQRLKVDVSNIFETGQLYTALSRAVDPNMLEVSGFEANKVKIDMDTINFCEENDLI